MPREKIPQVHLFIRSRQRHDLGSQELRLDLVKYILQYWKCHCFVLIAVGICLLVVSPVVAADCQEGHRPCSVALNHDLLLSHPVSMIVGRWYKAPNATTRGGTVRHFVRIVSSQQNVIAMPPTNVEVGFLSAIGRTPIIYSLCDRCYQRNPQAVPAGWGPYGNHGVASAFPIEFRIVYDQDNHIISWYIDGRLVREEKNSDFVGGGRIVVGVSSSDISDYIGQFWINNLQIFFTDSSREYFMPNFGDEYENLGTYDRKIMFIGGGSVYIGDDHE